MKIKSIYWKKIGETKGLMIVCLFISIFIVMIAYPGFMYTDSYARIDLAQAIAAGQTNGYQMWQTAIPSFFIAICLKLTGNVASYLFLQSFLYLYVSLLFIKRISYQYRWLQYLLFLLNPAFFCVGIYLEAGVGCLIGILLLLLLIFSDHIFENWIDRIVTVILLVLSSLVIFGYRANSFTIIPVIIILILIYKKSAVQKLIWTICLAAGVFLSVLVPKWSGIDTMSSVAAGFVWEIVTTIQDMEGDQWHEYIDFLDEIGGAGSTYDAVCNNDYTRIGVWLWFDRLGYKNLSEDGMTEKVIEKYVEFAKLEPKALMENKIRSVKCTMGYGRKLVADEWQYNCNGSMETFGYSDTSARKNFYELYLISLEKEKVWSRPYILFVCSLVLLIVGELLTHKRDKMWWGSFAVAVCYYGAFWINTQSYEVRYFFPSACLLLFVDGAVCCDLLYRLLVRRKR